MISADRLLVLLVAALVTLIALAALVVQVFPYAALVQTVKSVLRRERAKPARFAHGETLNVVLGLAPEKLTALFDAYKKQFGAGAARYARRTYEQ